MTSSTSQHGGEALALATGDREVPASYLAPTGSPPPGARVGLLFLGREGAHGLHQRVAERLAAAGYAWLAARRPGSTSGDGHGRWPPRHAADPRGSRAHTRRLPRDSRGPHPAVARATLWAGLPARVAGPAAHGDPRGARARRQPRGPGAH